MAIWQFRCNIIPSRENIDSLSCQEIISWHDVPQPICYIDFLEREKNWSPQIVQYGKIDETCIEFIFDKDKLIEIECRLDLRILTKLVFLKTIEYVQSINALFWVDNKVYLPKAEVMREVLNNSSANRYCRNPSEYFFYMDAGLR